MANDNTVFIGSKPPMNYVLAVITQFQNGAEEVCVKARGKAISKAVDVAEIVKNRFMENNLEIGPIEIGTQQLDGKEGGKLNVSTISLTLKSKGKEIKKPTK